MKPAVIKAGIRVLGSLAGLLGLSMLVFGLTLHLPNSIESGLAVMIGFSVFSILLGFYLCYVGFLAWCRFSPGAVRSVFGIAAFTLFAMLPPTHDHSGPAGAPGVFALLILVQPLACYVLYRCAVSYCCARLFPTPPQDGDIQAQLRES